MGLDCDRFKDSVPEEFICSICCNVFLKPVQKLLCEHMFCEECINSWLEREQTCPIDRERMMVAELKPGPRLLISLLGKLEIKCKFVISGCDTFVKLERL